jgi:hypothetical protein
MDPDLDPWIRTLDTSVFKDNKSLGSNKTVKIKFFLKFLLVDGRIEILIPTNNYESGSGTPEQRAFLRSFSDPQSYFPFDTNLLLHPEC